KIACRHPKPVLVLAESGERVALQPGTTSPATHSPLAEKPSGRRSISHRLQRRKHEKATEWSDPGGVPVCFRRSLRAGSTEAAGSEARYDQERRSKGREGYQERRNEEGRKEQRQEERQEGREKRREEGRKEAHLIPFMLESICGQPALTVSAARIF